MYAIVEIAGQQFKVEKDRSIYTHRLSGEEGAELVVDKVLLVDIGGVVCFCFLLPAESFALKTIT